MLLNLRKIGRQQFDNKPMWEVISISLVSDQSCEGKKERGQKQRKKPHLFHLCTFPTTSFIRYQTTYQFCMWYHWYLFYPVYRKYFAPCSVHATTVLGVAGLVAPAAVTYAHLPRSAKAGPRVEDSIGGPWGAQSLGSVVGLQQTRVIG